MNFIDLKQTSLEEVLSQFELTTEDYEGLVREAAYFDKYFLVGEGANIGKLTVFTQHLHDPWIDIELDNCDILNYRGKIPVEYFLDVMDEIFERTQLARASEHDLETFQKRGFRTIPNKEGRGVAILRPVGRHVKKGDVEKPEDKRLRVMMPEDLPEIKRLFEREYPFRYRAVELMYVPGSCFLFEEEDEIRGVIFNEKRENYLYCKELFVKDSERGREIARLLLSQAFWYAAEQGFAEVRGNARDRAFPLYRRLGAKFGEEIEYYLKREKRGG